MVLWGLVFLVSVHCCSAGFAAFHGSKVEHHARRQRAAAVKSGAGGRVCQRAFEEVILACLLSVQNSGERVFALMRLYVGRALLMLAVWVLVARGYLKGYSILM